jgi:hypothetical protein
MSELRQELQVDDMNLRRCVLNISTAEGAETAHHALSPIHSWSAPDSGVIRVYQWGDAVDGEKGSLQ